MIILCGMICYGSTMNTPSLNAVLRLAQAHSHVTRRLEASLAGHGLSMTELLVLLHLNAAPGGRLRRIDLAERLGMSPSSATRLLGPMEKIGLVSRESNARDARVAFAVIGRAGRIKAEETLATLAAAADRVIGGLLEDADAERLTELLGRLLAGTPGDLVEAAAAA